MPLLRQIAQLGHPVLRTPAALVPVPFPDAVRLLLDDMRETLHDAFGAGLAAPQVYESCAIFLLAGRAEPPRPGRPHPAPRSGHQPGDPRTVRRGRQGVGGVSQHPRAARRGPRHRGIRVRYRDADGAEVERAFVDFAARVFQHEYDHLHGVVFLDRLESSRDLISEKEYQKMTSR